MTKFYCSYWLSQNHSIHWRLKYQANIDMVFLREQDPSSYLPSGLVLISFSSVRCNNFPKWESDHGMPFLLSALGYQPESWIRLSMPWPWTHLPPLFPSSSRLQIFRFLRLFNHAILSPTSGTQHTLFPLLGIPVFLLHLLIHWTQRKCHYSDL